MIRIVRGDLFKNPHFYKHGKVYRVNGNTNWQIKVRAFLKRREHARLQSERWKMMRIKIEDKNIYDLDDNIFLGVIDGPSQRH